jgi:hypothetical protein
MLISLTKSHPLSVQDVVASCAQAVVAVPTRVVSGVAAPRWNEGRTQVSEHTCTKQGNSVRCGCGGQLAVSGTLNPLVDLGIGVGPNRKLIVSKTYSRKVVGYTGFCLKCRKEGRFLLSA